MSEKIFQSIRPGYLHPVCSELENRDTSVVVGDCSVTECQGWRPPQQIGKTVYVHAKHNKDRHTAPGVHGHGSVPMIFLCYACNITLFSERIKAKDLLEQG